MIRRLAHRLLGTTVLLLVLAASFSSCSSDDGVVGTRASATSGGSGSSAACPPATGTAERTTTFADAPPMCIDVNKTYTATFTTSAGPFTARLEPKLAPLAVNNFVFLARNHYYDGVPFHRIIPGFVIQGGDPNGKPAGTGDPGYSFEDELPADASVYIPGALAMANSGPDTNGSQFFIVLATGRLQPLYSHFGQVTEGFETTIQAIAKTGTASGTPSSVTTITTVTITES